MPTVKLVDEDCANPIVQRVFQDIKATKKLDRVPNIWRALATHPEHLELCWTDMKGLRPPQRAIDGARMLDGLDIGLVDPVRPTGLVGPLVGLLAECCRKVSGLADWPGLGWGMGRHLFLLLALLWRL